MKKLVLPVGIAAGLVAAAVLLWTFVVKGRSAPPAPVQPSVAVLPFTDLTPLKDHAWLSDGISEALINSLSRLKELRVPARTSSFFFKDRKEAVQDIGRMLNVEHVLEGSVQVAGGTLRVTADLISARNGYHLWSDRFDRKLEDVFAIQDDITREIVGALKVRLLGEERAQLEKKYTNNVEAYNLYLRGRYLWNRRTEEDMRAAVGFFERAIAKDPGYALAYAGLADGHILLGSWSIVAPADSFPESKRAALKALDIDPQLAEAHNALAFDVFAYDWDWAAAEKEFKRALDLDPNYAVGRQFYAEFLCAMGRSEEALAEMRRAQELDPLSPMISAVAGRPYIVMDRYDEAIVQYRKTLEMDPGFRPAHIYLGDAYLLKGMPGEALSEYEACGDRYKAGLAQALMGRKAAARQVLEELAEKSKRTYVSPCFLAILHFALGENDRGFTLLETAYETRDYTMSQINTNVAFKIVVPKGPRFDAFLKRMNLDRP